MDPELKEYLDAWSASRQREFDEYMACLDGLQRSMDKALGCFTAPVTTSSETAELVTASAGLADPPTLVPTTEKSLVVTPAVPMDTSTPDHDISTPAVDTADGQASSGMNKPVIASAGLADPPVEAPTTEQASVVAPMDTTYVAHAFCSMECSSHDATEPAPAVTPGAAPTTTVDVTPWFAAAGASNGTLDGHGISGVASTTATGLMVCLPRYPASSPLTPTQYVLNTNSNHVAAVPLAVPYVFPAVPVPAVHRPMPWPCFRGVQADGDATRPQPWPSFRDINSSEFPSDAVEKESQRCISASSCAKIGITIEFQISDVCGNLFTSTGYIIAHDLCNSSELKCLDDVLLFLEYWGSASDCLQSVHRYHTTLVWLQCTVSGFCLLVMVRSLELKLLSNGSTSITLLTVLLDSGNFAAWSCEYLGVDTTVCIGSWLFDGGSLVVCRETSVQSSTYFYPAKEFVAVLPSTMDWNLLDFPCRLTVTACLPCIQEPDLYLCSSQLKESLVLNLMRSSNSSYDQFACADHYTSCLPGYFVTGSQMQVPAACSTRHLFRSVVPSNFRPVVMFELQLTRSGSHFVYLRALQVDRSGIEGATLTRVIINVNLCLLKWSVSILAYPNDYCSTFCHANVGIFCERNLEFNNWVSGMVEQYTNMSSYGTQTGNGARITSEISNKDIGTLTASVDNGVATRKQTRILVWRIEVPWCTDLCNAAHAATSQEVPFRILWDPGGSTFCRWLWFSTYYDQEPFQGGRDIIAATTWDQWLLETRLYYYHQSDHINKHRLQWDPDGFSVVSAWGQVEFQEGRDVRVLAYMGLTPGPPHGPNSVPTLRRNTL